MVAVPDCTDPSTKVGDVAYMYADGFSDFDQHWGRVLTDLRTARQSAPPVSAADINALASLVVGLWSMHVIQGTVTYQGNWNPGVNRVSFKITLGPIYI